MIFSYLGFIITNRLLYQIASICHSLEGGNPEHLDPRLREDDKHEQGKILLC